MCDWLNRFYSYDTIAINKVGGCGLSNATCHTCPSEGDKVDTALAMEIEI